MFISLHAYLIKKKTNQDNNRIWVGSFFWVGRVWATNLLFFMVLMSNNEQSVNMEHLNPIWVILNINYIMKKKNIIKYIIKCGWNTFFA